MLLHYELYADDLSLLLENEIGVPNKYVLVLPKEHQIHRDGQTLGALLIQTAGDPPADWLSEPVTVIEWISNGENVDVMTDYLGKWRSLLGPDTLLTLNHGDTCRLTVIRKPPGT